MVGPFRFRLASVLTVWQHREDAALADLHRNQAATHAARRRLTQLNETRAAAASPVALTPRNEVVPHDPAWHRNWIVHLSMAIEAARDNVRRCEALEVTARLAWQRAQRDRRVLERLRDRARQRHETEARRDEMKVMDELAGLRTRPLLERHT
jgi:flagellar export protein FliJ